MKKQKNLLAIITGVHGDEKLGPRSIKKISLPVFCKHIVAHTKALRENTRFIETDLNRSFPGRKQGTLEEKIAYNLTRKLKKFNYVLDIHATDSPIKNTIITTRMNKKTKKLISYTPLTEIIIMPPNFGSRTALTHHTKCGITLEYGFGKQKINQQTISDINQIIDALKKNKTFKLQRNIYKVTKPFTISKRFKPIKKLEEFKKITKGSILGKDEHGIIKAPFTFYPVFTSKGSYDGTLCLMAEKKCELI